MFVNSTFYTLGLISAGLGQASIPPARDFGFAGQWTFDACW